MPEPKSINEILGDLGLPGAENRATAPAALKSVFAAISTVVNPDSSEEDQKKAALECLEVTGNSDMMVAAGLMSDGIRITETVENELADNVAAELVYLEEVNTAEIAHQKALTAAKENYKAVLTPAPAEETPADTAAEEPAEE